MFDVDGSLEVALTAFGKAPLGAVLRLGAAAPGGRALEQWVHDGLHHVRCSLGSGWVGAFDQHLAHSFVFRPRSGPTLAGLVQAAHDGHGRRFPMVVYGSLPTPWVDARILDLPCVLRPLFDRAQGVLQGLVSPQDFTPLRAAMRGAVALGPQHSDAWRYATFLGEVSCAEMAGPNGEPGERVLSELISGLSSVTIHPEALPVSLSLPLNQVPYARDLEVRFWLELVTVLMGWQPLALSYVAPLGASTSAGGGLHVCLRQPEGTLWGAMLETGERSDRTWRPGEGQPLPGRGACQLNLRLEPGHLLKDLLTYLTSGQRVVCAPSCLETRV